MSLLLDALKRAEQEKLARQAQEPHAAEHVLPAAAAEAAPRRRLELESHEATAAATAAATKRDREGVKVAFAAKQPEPLPPAPASGKGKAILGIAAAALLLLAAGGAYVWYELNKSPSPMARAPLPMTAPRPFTPAAGVAAQSATGTVTAASAPAGAAGGDSVPPVAILKPENVPAGPAHARPQPKAAEHLVMSLLSDSANAKPAPPLKLSRTIEAPRVSPEVSQGYDALKRGDAPAARKHYEAALAADATSLDAHLGLATAAARTGDRETATRHYRRALALDPKNASSIAGLAALADLSRPEGLEEQLRADITRYPQSPALHFTLGNLYASQSRWNEAQAAYFEAYRLDPDSADLAYNLAISLDHLGQAKLAADFYRRALAASRQQAAQFDKGQVTRRIAELKP
jgi:tetratricopeptide (TPR) repeat protein